MTSTDTSKISPTAHYTSYVWFRHGMSHPSLATTMGRTLFQAARPMNALAALSNGGLTLERMLLQRHRIIDHLLETAITSGAVNQLVEVACGLSPRGLTFAERYRSRGFTVVEGDLPDMASLKLKTLKRAKILGDNHHIVSLNVLHDDGPESLLEIAGRYLDPTAGTAIITEGLLGYFGTRTDAEIWQRFADVLSSASGGIHLADLHLENEMPDGRLPELFQRALFAATRGVPIDRFADLQAASHALNAAGFTTSKLYRPSELAGVVDIPTLRRTDILRIVEASVYS